MILVQAVVLALFLGLGARSQLQLQTTRDTARVQQQAMLLAKEMAEDTAEGDFADMQRLCEAMRSSAAVVTARAFGVDGRLQAVNSIGVRTLDQAEQEALQLALRDGKYYHIPAMETRGQEGFAPIILHGKVWGAVSIIADGEIGKRSMWIFIQNALVYSICALVANIVLAFLVGRTIAKPLSRLNRATQEVVRDTENTVAFPLPITTRNEAGQLTHSFNVMVRDLKQQRNGLTDTLALLDSMLENAPVGFAFFDRKLQIARANLFLERMLGHGVQRYFGRTLSSVHPGKISTEIEHAVEAVFVTGEDVHDRQIAGDLQGSDQKSEQRSWICSFYPVKPDGEVVRWVGMVMTEVTSRVREEEAMRRSEKLAAAGRLAASIAHEINNPLESVTNLLYLIRIQPSLDAEALRFTELAQRELARVSEITQQTLRFYRSSSRPETVLLGEVIESVLSLHAARLQAANIRIEREIDPAAATFGFSGELRQVFANLIGNAADAMSHGGRLRIRVAQHVLAGNAGVAIAVGDTGSGMSRQTQSHIFEPFYTTKEATGTGLGLWVSEEIVAKHGGTIRVRSRQGSVSGTVFRVYLPVNGLEHPIQHS